ncbi:MAG: hypothetical protein KJ579_02680 [Verrucomicrobia bacterium]|nr:hypothetical protein [Verrucomicrobiota bacterium]
MPHLWRGIKLARWVSIFGFGMATVLFCSAAAMTPTDAVDAVQRAADVASQMDVTRLALVVAIIAMLVSLAKDYWMARAVIELRDEFRMRPCVKVGRHADAERSVERKA